MELIRHLGALTSESRDVINNNFASLALGLSVGKVYYVDPALGGDGISSALGQTPAKAYKTLYKGEDVLRTGRNDVCVLVGSGSSSGWARLSAALAASVDPAATTGVLTWDKNAAHLIGNGPSNMFGARTSIRVPSGTYTMGTFGSGNFVVVSGSGCYFKNINFNQSFSTGGAAEICVTVSGSYNVFEDCQFCGNQDTYAAGHTDSRSLLVTGGCNTFRRCVVGYESATARRGAANASLEFASSASSNYFEDCLFPFKTQSTDVLGILVAAASALNGIQYFNRCTFANWGALAGSSTMAALATIAQYSGGGLYFKDCSRFLITDWGTDANSLAQMYLQGSGDENQAGDEIGRALVASAS